MVRVGGVGRRGRTLGFDCLERQPHIPTKEQLGHNYIPVRRTRPSKNVSMINKKGLSQGSVDEAGDGEAGGEAGDVEAAEGV